MSFELQGSGTYEDVVLQAKALIEDEPELVPNMANLSALLNLTLKNINWVGIFTRCSRTVICCWGRFRVNRRASASKRGAACAGTALAEKKTLRVADVHAFPGHIACDSASRAEIVVPVTKDGKVYAVLDVDSPFEDRFTAEDEAFLEKIAALLAEKF